MIYTVTFNPSLDYIVSIDDFKFGKTNRTTEELMLAGGKGLNVSTVLYNLGIPNIALGFTAGFVGEELKKMLQQLQDPSIINDAEKCNDLMNRYSELRQTQNLMAKHLGDRVVIKA